MRRSLLICIAVGLVWPVAASANTVRLGPSLPLGSGTVNPVPCGSVASDCWYINVQLPAGEFPAATQSGTITSWSVEGLAGQGELVILRYDGNDEYSIVGQSAPVSEPCGSSGGVCTVGSGVKTSSTNLSISAGDYVGVRLISPANCFTAGPNTGCSVVGGVSGATDGGLGADTMPEGQPSDANSDPDATIGLSATEETGSPSSKPPAGSMGVAFPDDGTATVVATQAAEDARIRLACPSGEVGDCYGSILFQVCANKDKTANKSFSECTGYIKNVSRAVAARAQRVTIAEASFRLPPGAKRSITLHLDAVARKLLAKHHRIATEIVATTHVRGAHATRVTTHRITLQLKR